VDPEREHPNHRQALKAWGRGQFVEARELWKSCIEQAEKDEDIGWLTFYLQSQGQMEGEAGNAEAFHALHQRALALEPDAPLLLLFYARDLWTVLKDKESSLREIERLEVLLASDRWDRTGDLSLSAYQQKISTLRAWIQGEPGGPLWP
jgi:hypothetical protein